MATFSVKFKLAYQEYPYEQFVVKNNKTKLASCHIVYPKFFSNEDGYAIHMGGYITLYREKEPNFVRLFNVESYKKRKGYGTLLFHMLTEYLKTKGIKRIYLDTNIDNIPAQLFYEALNFKVRAKSKSTIYYVSCDF